MSALRYSVYRDEEVRSSCGCVNLIDGGIRWCPLHKNAARLRDVLRQLVLADQPASVCQEGAEARALLREVAPQLERCGRDMGTFNGVSIICALPKGHAAWHCEAGFPGEVAP